MRNRWHTFLGCAVRGQLFLLVCLALSGCAGLVLNGGSQIPGAEQGLGTEDPAGEASPDQEADGARAGDVLPPDDESGEQPGAADGAAVQDERFFTTPEGSIVATPWFHVSSVVLRVQRSSRRTVIVLPEESIMRDYMRLDPNVVLDADDVRPSARYMLGLGIALDGAQPFTSTMDRARARRFSNILP